MCLDLRNTYFKNIDEVELVLNNIPGITNEDLIRIGNNKEEYENILGQANNWIECNLIL